MAAADLVTRVVFALERCAKTDPPPTFSDLVWTDQGPARYGWDDESPWQDHEGYELKPSVWYDLRHADGEGVTVEDLRGVCYLADAGLIAAKEMGVTPPDGWEPTEEMLTRVRAALDALTRKEDKYQ